MHTPINNWMERRTERRIYAEIVLDITTKNKGIKLISWCVCITYEKERSKIGLILMVPDEGSCRNSSYLVYEISILLSSPALIIQIGLSMNYIKVIRSIEVSNSV